MSDITVGAFDAEGGWTVVVPACNAAKTLTGAVASALAAGAHVLVVDDGSRDSTAEQAKELGASVLSTRNQGAYQARLAGLRLVEDPYVLFLDADDVLFAPGVAAALKMLRSRPELVGVIGTYRVIARGRTRPAASAYTEISTQTLIRTGFAPGPPGAAVWRTGKLRHALETGPDALDLRESDDYELVLRASMAGPIARIPDRLCDYAIAGGKSVRSTAFVDECREKLRGYYAEIAGVPVKEWSSARRRSTRWIRAARACAGEGQRARAVALAAGATILDPVLLTRAVWRRAVWRRAVWRRAVWRRAVWASRTGVAARRSA